MIVALLYFALLLGCGTFLIRPLALRPGERLLPAYVAGSCAFGVLGFGLAHTHALNATAAIAIILVSGTLSLIAWRAFATEVVNLLRWTNAKLLSGDAPLRLLVAIAFVFYFLVLILLADTPPRSGDAMRYHLAQLKDMVDHGGFVFRPYLHYHYAQYFSLVFFPVYIFGGGIGMKFAVLLTFVISLIAILKIADRIGVISLRLVAAVLMLVPITYQEATIITTDWPSCAYILCAIYMLLVFLDRKQFQIVLAAYLAMGMAIGTKVLAGMTLPWLVYLHWFKSDGEKGKKAREIIIGLAVLGIVASPFYFRSLYYFGNPFWPVLQDLFSTDNHYLDLIARSYSERATGPHSIETAITTLREIALSPLIPASFWMMGWFAALRTRSRIDIGTGFLLFFGLWWIIAPLFVWRYSIFMLPFAAIAIGALIDQLREERPSWTLRFLQVGIAITLAYGVAIGARYSTGLLAWHTDGGKADYHHATWYYDEYAWINQNLPESAKLLVFASAGQTYYLDREYVRADPRLSAAIQWTSVKNVESFRRVLNELEIDYIFVDWAVLTSAPEAPHLSVLFDELVSSDVMEMLWTREDVKLFRSRIRGEYTTHAVSLFKLIDSKPNDPMTTSAQPL